MDSRGVWKLTYSLRVLRTMLDAAEAAIMVQDFEESDHSPAATRDVSAACLDTDPHRRFAISCCGSSLLSSIEEETARVVDGEGGHA